MIKNLSDYMASIKSTGNSTLVEEQEFVDYYWARANFGKIAFTVKATIEVMVTPIHDGSVLADEIYTIY